MAEEITIWDKEEVIDRIPINERGEIIRVARVKRGGADYIDVRRYYRSRETGNLLPGKGIAIPAAFAKAVAEAVLKSITEAGEDRP